MHKREMITTDHSDYPLEGLYSQIVATIEIIIDTPVYSDAEGNMRIFRKELRRWLNNNANHNVEYSTYSLLPNRQTLRFAFESMDDALMFKLAWG